MSKLPHVVVTALVSLGSLVAMGQTTPADHSQHHPAGAPPASAAQQSPSAPSAATPAVSDRMAAMDKQMHAMNAMREKLAAAKTPEERRAAMTEHMKTMQNSMAMMDMMKSPGGMGGMRMMGTPPSAAGGVAQPNAMAPGMASGHGGMMPMMEGMHQSHQMMEKRMEMMESMMRMMMDRMQ